MEEGSVPFLLKVICIYTRTIQACQTNTRISIPPKHTIVILLRSARPISTMPAERVAKRAAASVKENAASLKRNMAEAVDSDVSTTHTYPASAEDRENAINRHTGRKVTPFQFQVYDLCAQIPRGQISTYKHISDALGSSSRAVGQALKINPYAPLPVPCHRVLDSKLYIGGFMGQWGEGEKIDNKRAKLAREGVTFDETDHVSKDTREKVMFKEFRVKEAKSDEE